MQTVSSSDKEGQTGMHASDLNIQYISSVGRQKADIQGAEDKLGQFLSQDIYATANHRNCF